MTCFEGLLSSLFALSTTPQAQAASIPYALLLRLLRRWSTRTHEIAKVFRRRETSVVVRPAINDLSFLGHILARSAERVLDRAERSVKQRQHLVVFVTYEFSNELPALGRVGFA